MVNAKQECNTVVIASYRYQHQQKHKVRLSVCTSKVRELKSRLCRMSHEYEWTVVRMSECDKVVWLIHTSIWVQRSLDGVRLSGLYVEVPFSAPSVRKRLCKQIKG